MPLAQVADLGSHLDLALAGHLHVCVRPPEQPRGPLDPLALAHTRDELEVAVPTESKRAGRLALDALLPLVLAPVAPTLDNAHVELLAAEVDAAVDERARERAQLVARLGIRAECAGRGHRGWDGEGEREAGPARESRVE